MCVRKEQSYTEKVERGVRKWDSRTIDSHIYEGDVGVRNPRLPHNRSGEW